MNSRVRNLMFLFGMAPLGLGCNGGKAEDDDGTDTGETGSTGPTGTGSTTAGTATASSTTATTTTTDDGTEDTGSTGDLCQDYAASYGDCYGSYYAGNALEWCAYTQDYVQQYNSPECLSAWEAAIACMTTADCGLRYEQCQAEFLAQEQACFYSYGNVYEVCYMVGEFVAGCVNPGVFESAMGDCVDTWYSNYSAYGPACGDAFLTMMVCISQLDCLALSDKQYVYASCGPEIQAKNLACQ